MCLCQCGNRFITTVKPLRSGSTTSCGCSKRDRAAGFKLSHGMVGTRIYITYKNMKSRCYNPCKKQAKDYFGKGIAVYKAWRNDFASFYKWSMENGYDENMTIDRINPHGPYAPWNCQFMTLSENIKKSNLQKKTYFPV